jgi:hypothetical protein
MQGGTAMQTGVELPKKIILGTFSGIRGCICIRQIPGITGFFFSENTHALEFPLTEDMFPVPGI